MKTTYLNEFAEYSKNKLVFVPAGTIEWHGNHLPVETDFLVAKKVCEIMSKKTKGYVLPPIYLGTDKERIKNGKKFVGINSQLSKELAGNLYYLKPHIFLAMISGLMENLSKQGFKKIYIITGHGGSKHIEVLKKVEEKFQNVVLINAFEHISVHTRHADENETSVFWACYPEEEAKSRKRKIESDDDFVKFKGYDPREKASLKLGKKLLNEMIENLSNIIR